MIAALQRMFDAITRFFDAFWDWLTHGLYDLLIWGLRGYVEFMTLQAIRFKIFVLTIAWDTAKAILVDLDVSAKLQALFDLLPPAVALNVSALRVPEAVMLILTAYGTRYVMRFIPGAGS